MNRHTKHVVAFERFNQISWEVQYTRIRAMSLKYNNALVMMDTTGLGDPIIGTLTGMGIRVEGYKIGGSTAKQQLIENLRVKIENADISFPASLNVTRSELENYEYEITDSGIVRYNAPVGQHDDCVISLALANWACDSVPWVYKYSNRRI